MTVPVFITAVVGVAVVGLALGWALARLGTAPLIQRARDELAEAEALSMEAKRESETARKEATYAAKEESLRLRTETERENKAARAELQRVERRLRNREENLERKQSVLEKAERDLADGEGILVQKREELEGLKSKARQELEKVSGIQTPEARELILRTVEEEMQQELAIRVREMEEKARKDSERQARKIVSLAIQRCCVDQASESTVSVVPLQGDEMKGRIIGREGRNIRMFEGLTGVDLIVDDTPEAVVLSCFDPIRREVARIALSNLVSDGRIHPGRIEDVVNKARSEVKSRIHTEGERACLETGLTGVPPPLIELLGKLFFRTSFGQNMLDHSIEVSHLAAMIASEIGANANIARRGGLFHDIGKALDHEMEGTHIQLGVDLLRRHRESENVIHCVAAHHEDVPLETVEAVIVYAADSISSTRPGARRENLETYVKRLQALEEIADSFEGVDKSFAIQAGREVRIIVRPDEVDDIMSVKLAREIAGKIQGDLQYPGEIKVTVIRETRATDFAR
ncbi:MAG: ribonuclease Y [Armatimonadetes bacterium CG2_30_59_28]|nr:ribonuclease Y [Armatimonadota bacterium]OIO98060.1 MAG: ribonuclease Y [Armatimonadetes bacterium CG2_30_59_28]PIU67366.1 MAG: ribonuclease Y [Armatimonadetes bacterium CG07_land_8_20_14_0_80_59_28]PIX40605.1 MAG: ribonuclease Y [Armatimonadetes bacterium CG_4_8_14_3_um_filter_58_9]PIY41879.1 MAG: ribonuclease Y [Armatimonadetes bacterium CG_4_10_14_3_um_filter_59_10]